MPKINLRDYYPWYIHDEFVDVPDEVAHAMAEAVRLENAQRRRIYYHKAHYSLDAGDGIEYEVCSLNLSPHEIYEHQLICCLLREAVNALPETQGRRVEAHFILGMNQKTIAEAEGVSGEAISKSIEKGIAAIRKILIFWDRGVE
jgi:RNA polymerase sigma-70 factor (ECF subfamily)